MDRSQGTVARWRLHLSKFKYKVCTRAGREHHCSDSMSRLKSPAADTSPIREEKPCFVLPNVGRGWRAPLCDTPEANEPVTTQRILEAQLRDPHCLEVHHQMDLNRNSRFSESTDEVFVRVSLFYWATQVYVPQDL